MPVGTTTTPVAIPASHQPALLFFRSLTATLEDFDLRAADVLGRGGTTFACWGRPSSVRAAPGGWYRLHVLLAMRRC